MSDLDTLLGDAVAMVPERPPISELARRLRRRRRRRWTVAAGGVATILVACAVTIAAAHRPPAPNVVAGDPARRFAAGPEVALEEPTADDARLPVASAFPGYEVAQPGTRRPVARLADGTLVAFRYTGSSGRQCAIAYAPPSTPGGHPNGVAGCADPPKRPDSFATNDNLIWVNVPDGAVIVRVHTDSYQAWQRPLAGVAMFVVPGAARPSTIGFHLDALDAHGRLLASEDWTDGKPTFTYRDSHGALVTDVPVPATGPVPAPPTPTAP